MHKLFSRISLLCLLSLAYSVHVVAFDDGSGVGVFSDDVSKSPLLSSEHNQLAKEATVLINEQEVLNHEPNNTDQNMFVRWWQESTSGQIWGLAGIVAILGYGMHQLYAWYKKCNATLPAITEYDYEVAKTLLEAMHNDMEQLKSGSKKLPRVNLVDLSKVTPEFAQECQEVVAVFMNIYKTCRENAKNMVMLETFYSNVADAMHYLKECVEQSDENETLIVINEDEA